MSRKPRPQPRARAAVVRLPHRERRDPWRLAPSARSVVLGLVLAALATLGYFAARESTVFAIRTIEVHGASPALARHVRAALLPLEGESLLKLRSDDVSRLATALPRVESVAYDRSFPNTLVVRVEPERPLAVLRRGNEWWLVSRRGRVMARLAPDHLLGMPRIWVTKNVEVGLGAMLTPDGGAEEVAALLPLRAAGLELRVGTADNLALKLAVAHRILADTDLSGYLDVSVPERPVSGQNSQLSG